MTPSVPKEQYPPGGHPAYTRTAPQPPRPQPPRQQPPRPQPPKAARPKPAIRPPSPKRQRSFGELLTLAQIPTLTPPWTARVQCYVETMRKWGFSQNEGRFVLRVRLRDPSGRVDADFAEAELARLLGGPSRELREVDAGVKAAREAALQTAISKYEGVLTLRAGAARPATGRAACFSQRVSGISQSQDQSGALKCVKSLMRVKGCASSDYDLKKVQCELL